RPVPERAPLVRRGPSPARGPARLRRAQDGPRDTCMSALNGASVARVQATLEALGSQARIVELSETARSAEDAARAVGCELGAIVKSLVFAVGGRPVMALVAGDRRCDAAALPAILGLEGEVARANADLVRQATGFAIGGVAPVGHDLP